MFKRQVLYILLHFGLVVFSPAQQQNLPLNREFNLVNQKVFNNINNNTHTAFQPIIQSFIQKDSSISSLSESERGYYLINISKSTKKPNSFFKWLYRTAFYENFAVVDTGNFYLTVDPLLNLESGKDQKDSTNTSRYKNTRGIIIRGNVGNKLSFQSSFYENQAIFPSYMSDFVENREVVPGQGRVKKFKDGGYDFASASANISYTPFSFLNVQLGTGKNFIGDGYRSILLSDQSFNYPYFKITTQFGKNNQFQYVTLDAQLSNLVRREEGSTGEALFQRKAMSIHYINWVATNWLHIGLFENTIWRTEDSLGTQPFQFQQLNPVYGVNTLTTINNEFHHSVVGVNTKIKFPFQLVLYNQLIYDGHQYEKTKGYQIGLKYLGLNYVALQVEYNVMDNPYASTFYPNLQQFHHYNEYIAHPLGDNFEEIVGIINFKFKRVFSQLKVNYAILPNRDIMNFQTHLGYLVNPKNNMSVVVGLNNRREEEHVQNIVNETNYIYVGFRTALRNLYNDF